MKRLTLGAARAERVKWLSQIKWDVFATATFPTAVGDQRADGTFTALINNLERSMRIRIAYVYGRESASRRRLGVGVHYHFVLTALRPIPHSIVTDGWRRLVRTSHNRKDDSICINAYDPEKPGLDYMLKMADDDRGDWGFWNLAHFLPADGEFAMLTPRAERRWNEQLAAA